MKFLFIFVLGVAAGAYGLHRYEQRSAFSPSAIAPAIGHDARSAAADTESTVDQKLVAWHLTSDDIRQDLARTGAVARSKAQVVGQGISDTRIVAVIKAKYVLDRNLSACDLHVSSQDGAVTLNGSALSPDLVGRAVTLALDTDGVTNVTSRIALVTR